MFFTFVVRPGEAPEGRGPQLEPFWTFLVNYNLRLGLLIQLTAYATLLATTSSGGKDPLSLLSFFRSNPESVGKSPLWAAQLACCLFILGNLTTMAFQSLTDDDSSIKQSRGYRSGTKFLQQASSFGLFASTLALLVFYSANYYFDDPWMSKNFGSGSSWLIFFTSRVCDAFALFFYAGSIFFLEAYHSEGAGEAWGWLGAICFKLAAFAEIAALAAWGSSSFEVLDAVFTVMLGVSLSIAFLWSLFFEPASHRFDVRLTQSAMRNEYYKSRNAMAYYGPAVVNADGEIDIAAAAEQAQACLNCTPC
ncbi:hypothetical protein, conserved [Eimeria tenella]|uniref:Multi-pass transmembrane protein n=1 Tax=Eimeria tenella TaxID=5802 RepID=U6KNH5_EIMTE|nr:hypothetical protein, conserved [Eimeria tenella]CDJ38361.1 hypothetical protein, conserved [Eimeria tenella]|eukprot:XP_013229199.1 hypothetical protein, conserved [Eimeria tenella]